MHNETLFIVHVGDDMHSETPFIAHESVVHTAPAVRFVDIVRKYLGAW